MFCLIRMRSSKEVAFLFQQIESLSLDSDVLFSYQFRSRYVMIYDMMMLDYCYKEIEANAWKFSVIGTIE